MAEEDALPEGAFAVSVMHVVDPRTFWVTEPPGKDMTKEREELNCLEEMLSGYFRRSAYNYQGVNYLPEEGELVAVQHPDTRRWHRAHVEDVLHLTNGYVYKLFLVDHGVPVQVPSSAIRRLPTTYNDLDFQAFQVELYGVIPTTVEMDYTDMKMKRELSDSWTAAAVRFVKKLLEESTKSWLVYHKNIKKKIYGDLYVELSNGKFSLSNELCTQEYAVWSEEHFEGVNMLINELQSDQLYEASSPSVCIRNMKLHTRKHNAYNDKHERSCQYLAPSRDYMTLFDFRFSQRRI